MNPASYQLGDNFDPPSEQEDSKYVECTQCGNPYKPDEDSTFESGDLSIDSFCSEEKAEELNAQIEYAGYGSLTENELLFLEWWNKQ